MKEIPLSAGRFALVDDEDFDQLEKFRWHWEGVGKYGFGGGYAVRHPSPSRAAGKKLPKIRMHRIIMNAPVGVEVDHINGNGLDNRRENLRFATRRQQLMNTATSRRSETGVKGVGIHTQSGVSRFRARIHVYGTEHHLGEFDTLEEAVLVRKAAENRFQRSFARQTS